MNKVKKKCVDSHSGNTLIVTRSDELAVSLHDDRYDSLVATRWARRAGLLGNVHPLTAVAIK